MRSMSWLACLLGGPVGEPKPRRRAARPPARPALVLERLEDRTLLSSTPSLTGGLPWLPPSGASLLQGPAAASPGLASDVSQRLAMAQGIELSPAGARDGGSQAAPTDPSGFFKLISDSEAGQLLSLASNVSGVAQTLFGLFGGDSTSQILDRINHLRDVRQLDGCAVAIRDHQVLVLRGLRRLIVGVDLVVGVVVLDRPLGAVRVGGGERRADVL